VAYTLRSGARRIDGVLLSSKGYSGTHMGYFECARWGTPSTAVLTAGDSAASYGALRSGKHRTDGKYKYLGACMGSDKNL
jgi:hypothetical protein